MGREERKEGKREGGREGRTEENEGREKECKQTASHRIYSGASGPKVKNRRPKGP